MSKIYYWANNTNKNSGEGILALNFLKLLKKNYKNCSLIKLNTFGNKENFFYNYILPFFGVFKLWKYYLKGKKICYINYLPIWNILILIILPKKTILGPITGSNLKTSTIYILLKNIGIFLLKKKNKPILFSHSQFRKYFNSNKKVYYNFMLYNFKFRRNFKKKKFDFIIYFRKNKNKGNDFLINAIEKLSKKFKVIVIGDSIPKYLKNKNILNYKNIKRKKALNYISQSKNSIISKENSLSFFALDCVSYHLNIFHNINDKLNEAIKTNIFNTIKFDDLNYSIKKITKNAASKKSSKYFKFKSDNFSDYLNSL